MSTHCAYQDEGLTPEQIAGIERAGAIEMARRGIPAAISYPIALVLLFTVLNNTALSPLYTWIVGAVFIVLLGLRIVLHRAFDRI